MSEKSKSWFLALKTEDPASNAGIISLYKVGRTPRLGTRFSLSVLVAIAKFLRP